MPPPRSRANRRIVFCFYAKASYRRNVICQSIITILPLLQCLGGWLLVSGCWQVCWLVGGWCWSLVVGWWWLVVEALLSWLLVGCSLVVG